MKELLAEIRAIEGLTVLEELNNTDHVIVIGTYNGARIELTVFVIG